MKPHNWTLPTERIQTNGGRPVDAVRLGPLAVNFNPRVGAWVVTHCASGAFVGEPWPTLPRAIAAAGALLVLPVDWYTDRPLTNGNQALVERALGRVGGLL